MGQGSSASISSGGEEPVWTSKHPESHPTRTYLRVKCIQEQAFVSKLLGDSVVRVKTLV